MKQELYALIMKSESKVFDEYEKDLTDYGYSIIRCNADKKEIITQTLKYDCDVIILSSNGFESEEELLETIAFFDDATIKNTPLILNAPESTSLKIERAADRYKFFFNIYPTGEKRSIIMEIEKNECFKRRDCDDLFYRLKHKVTYECRYIGLSKSHEGFRWISEAVLLIICDPLYKKNFSCGTYKVLENKYDATYTQIESAIRRCMNEYQSRMDPYIKIYYFELDPNSNGKYTITSFISKIAENIKLTYNNTYRAFMANVDHDRRKAISEYYKL